MTGGAGAHKKTLRVHGREQPSIIPVFPLPGAILLPHGQLPLNIFEPRYLRMVDDALAGARTIGMIQPRDDGAGAAPLYGVGCAGRITSFNETGDGRYLITLTGVLRFGVKREFDVETPYRQAEVDYSAFVADADLDESAESVDRERLLDAMRSYLETENLSTDWDAAVEAPTDALVNSLAMGCPFAPNEKQALLEAPTIADRAECLVALMSMGGDPSEGQTVQ
ncbi:MAG TPA: LON peptidase substrate-binding domain-containing protein [Parvularculaceae bacterium]|nr:LON peptidase substrate-binding domain-containing protein [Parvularculaceae bacterium]